MVDAKLWYQLILGNHEKGVRESEAKLSGCHSHPFSSCEFLFYMASASSLCWKFVRCISPDFAVILFFEILIVIMIITCTCNSHFCLQCSEHRHRRSPKLCSMQILVHTSQRLNCQSLIFVGSPSIGDSINFLIVYK